MWISTKCLSPNLFRLKPSIFHDKEEKEEKEEASNELFELSELISFLPNHQTQNPLDFHIYLKNLGRKIGWKRKLREHLRMG